ncbi:hypothetical protein A4G29_05950 [Mycobacterium kansasii]|nr:hypothetical protein A4G29_05950 [Mycobacterium kansasii]
MPGLPSINLIIVGHPRRRMAERGITEDDIKRAIRSCFADYPATDGAWCHAGYGMDGRSVLKVWTMPPLSHEGRIVVKSAAWKGKR